MLARIVEPPRHRLVQRLDGQRRFTAAGDARYADERAERHFGTDVLEIVSRRADELQPAVMRGPPPFCRQRYLSRPRKILSRQARRIAHDVGRQALGYDLAAVDTGAWAHVDDV